MKKTILSVSCAAALSLVCLSNGFAAEQKHQQRHAHSETQKPQGEITPPAGTKVTKGWDVFVTADFIYYNAVQSGMPYAYNGVLNNAAAYIPAGEPFAAVPQGQIANVAQDWAPGFKVGLGCKTNHDNWSVYAEYTYLRAGNTQTLTQAGTSASNDLGLVNPGLTEYYGSEASTGAAYGINSIKGSWRLNHNKIDLSLARNFHISQHMTLKPFAGLSGVWQDQSVTTWATQNMFTVGEETYTNVDFRDRVETKAYAIGLRGGMDMGWYFTKALSLQSSFAGNALWTNYHGLTFRSTMYEPVSEQTFTFVNMDNPNQFNVNYVAEAELALCYEWLSQSQDYGFMIQAGWEAQTWINWGLFLSNFDVGTDFSLQGANVRVRFDF